MWISTGFLDNYSLGGLQTSYQFLKRLKFSGEFTGGTIGGLDLLGGGGFIRSSAKYSGAFKQALNWLKKRGFKAEKVNVGRLRETKGKGVGMTTKNEKVGFRVEYDQRSGAHINVFNGKEKGPHFKFDATESTVKKIQRRFHKLLGIKK